MPQIFCRASAPADPLEGIISTPAYDVQCDENGHRSLVPVDLVTRGLASDFSVVQNALNGRSSYPQSRIMLDAVDLENTILNN